MPSFDIVNRVDMQEVDNAVNLTRKIITTRYDFRKSQTEINLNRKEQNIRMITEDTMKMKAVQDELIGSLVKRKVDPKVLDFKEVEPASKGMLKCEVRLVDGIDMDTARSIVKMIKDLKLKVQAQIQDNQVRVSGKKIDDLQTVIAMLKKSNLKVPLQFVNIKD
ncbi:MAG: YajQ family cyclic di-GMP-binding protein [Nitrospirae bacterium CG08_land_8_20_14_0_20_52_24]|nr:MAG: YajQ family cyclic di-GMP-binding protein [Nitrospirae bacterium CG08_land_8_20_14_0_20_52_24]PIW85283.1 MAG: YajQ family cyclic di-GMP-binding protein [Nitrospirae bacterium CG_4_8_14_3_um_filter_50_41]PIX85801.1 MAG: YajQ family cyclic di-GMP-binding protein [Nitrospirae bacterium CG_4_10_14_3_um_filter_53_41]